MGSQSRTVEQVVAKNECTLFASEELFTKNQSLGEAIGLVLNDVLNVNTKL